MAKLTKRKLLNKSPSDIGKMKSAELREFLRGARQLFDKQYQTFERYKEKVYSPALEKMNQYYSDSGEKSVSRMRVSEMRNEIFRLQEFFDAKTSTLPGARTVMLEQDKKIFGVDSKGRAKKRMTLEQRTNFWSAYNEFKSMQKEAYFRNMGSNTIQQFLGEMVIESSKRGGRNKGFGSAADYQELQRRLEEQREQEDWELANYEYGDDDVFSGKWPY